MGGIFDNIGHLFERARSGQASEAEVHEAYDQVANRASSNDLADGLAHTFKSDPSQPFHAMIGRLFGQSNPEQRSGLLNTLLRRLDPTERSQVLGSRAAAVGSGNVTPEQAQQLGPQDAERLAEHAARKDPSVLDEAAGFYAQHPGLVKTLGIGALTLLMSRIRR